MLTVGGTYVDDLELVDAAHVVYVRSPIAHARIASVDVAAAMAAPGVLAVLSAADCDLPSQRPEAGAPAAMSRPMLPAAEVCYAGQAVAMLVAERRAEAVDAAELVAVDYDPLPAVVDCEAAAAGAPYVHGEAGTNLVSAFTVGDPATVL